MNIVLGVLAGGLAGGHADRAAAGVDAGRTPEAAPMIGRAVFTRALRAAAVAGVAALVELCADRRPRAHAAASTSAVTKTATVKRTLHRQRQDDDGRQAEDHPEGRSDDEPAVAAAHPRVLVGGAPDRRPRSRHQLRPRPERGVLVRAVRVPRHRLGGATADAEHVLDAVRRRAVRLRVRQLSRPGGPTRQRRPGSAPRSSVRPRTSRPSASTRCSGRPISGGCRSSAPTDTSTRAASSDVPARHPEASPANYTSLSLPTNETFGVTGTDGKGAATFDIFTNEDHPSLGCSANVPCSLVAVPIEGVSCDPEGSLLPEAQRPTGSDIDDARTNCESKGNFQPGQQLPAQGSGAAARSTARCGGARRTGRTASACR